MGLVIRVAQGRGSKATQVFLAAVVVATRTLWCFDTTASVLVECTGQSKQKLETASNQRME